MELRCACFCLLLLAIGVDTNVSVCWFVADDVPAAAIVVAGVAMLL